MRQEGALREPKVLGTVKGPLGAAQGAETRRTREDLSRVLKPTRQGTEMTHGQLELSMVLRLPTGSGGSTVLKLLTDGGIVQGAGAVKESGDAGQGAGSSIWCLGPSIHMCESMLMVTHDLYPQGTSPYSFLGP